MQKELYLKIKKPSARYAYYFFFDTTPYLADQIFIRHELRVWFGDEFTKDGSPYRGILCHVRKKDAPVFESCMKELEKNMIICGHPDYEREITGILNGFDRRERKVRKNENDTTGKTKQEEPA